MFKSIKRLRKEEKFLMLFAVVLTVAVFYFINYVFTGQFMVFWALVQTGIMWIIIISLLILADNQRLLNEELKEIIKEHIGESKTLKKISNEQLQEIKVLNRIADEAMQLIKKKK